MKKRNIALSYIAIITAIAIVFSACRKINEATELGGDLIPPIDNINTFETFLDIETDNQLFNDTTKVYYNDALAVGHISSDPEFGATHADAYFNISSSSYMINPFVHKDSVTVIDSVILSLPYDGSYGDTLSNLTLRVFEIAQGPAFNDTTLYKYNQPDFATTGGQLGSKTFQVQHLKDSITYFRKYGDTAKLANVIRIPLSNSLGDRFKNYDTTSNPASGAYRDDTLFKNLFRGFAIKADNSGSALVYITPSDLTKAKLIVYYRKKNGKTTAGVQVIDTTSAEFYHLTGGNANVVRRTPAAGWASYLANGIPNDDKIYLQSVPGSLATLTIPGLSTFNNAVIHRAEIIATPLPSTDEKTYTQPLALFLDRINAAGDTAFTFDNDMRISWTTSLRDPFTYEIDKFGGLLKSDSTYSFNISRYVQNLITNKTTNYKFRVYTPIRAFEYSPGYDARNQIYVTDRVAYGRVVLAGGNYINPAKKMRLRIVYSKL